MYPFIEHHDICFGLSTATGLCSDDMGPGGGQLRHIGLQVAVTNRCSRLDPLTATQNRKNQSQPMALTKEMRNVADRSMQRDLSMTLSPEYDDTASFRAVFKEKMPTSRKPIKYEQVSALLLSYDSSDREFAEYDLQNEVRCVQVGNFKSKADT
jgi:hypothetical protein